MLLAKLIKLSHGSENPLAAISFISRGQRSRSSVTKISTCAM